MDIIWYLLKCPKGNEADYIKECKKLANLEDEVVQEVICFQYLQMLRYGGDWHLKRRMLLPGHIFLSGTEKVMDKYGNGEWNKKNAYSGKAETQSVLLTLCHRPYLKEICPEGDVIAMSKGIIRNGRLIVISGPLKGREQLIRKVDRHKRTAQIEVPFETRKMMATIGLEIYQKQI